MSVKRAAGPPSLTLESMVVASPQQVSCDLAGEVVVLSLKNGTYYAMDPVAARIWELLAEPQTVRAIRDVILGEFEGVAEAQCTRDVQAFLDQLLEWDLAQVA